MIGGFGRETAERLAAFFERAGMPCEIEAGKRGLVVYASTSAIANKVANDLAMAVRLRVSRVLTTTAKEDLTEPGHTRWWTMVEFDWVKF